MNFWRILQVLAAVLFIFIIAASLLVYNGHDDHQAQPTQTVPQQGAKFNL